jgi:hypothetical protein
MGSPLRGKVIATTPEGKRIFGYNKKGVPVCYAKKPLRGKLPEEQEYCMNVATAPNGRCKVHGGKVPSGIMHWNAQHLRTAVNLPKHLQGDMNRALNDPDNKSLDHEIALTDTHIAQLKEALATGLDTAAWKRLRSLADALEHSLEKDPERSERLCNEIINIIRVGSGERVVWKEYHEVEECRRKLVETAHRREVQLKTLLKADQAIALVTGMAAAGRTCVANTIAVIETEYILVHRASNRPVDNISGHIKSDFLSSLGNALSNLVGQARPNPNIPSGIDGNRQQEIKARQAAHDEED